MNWFLQHLLDGAVTAAVLAAVVWLFGRQFLGGYLGEKGKNLATKEDVERLTRQVEAVRSEFARLAVEHAVGFSKLHERRANVIARLYRLLVVVTWRVDDLGSLFEWTGEPSKQEKYSALLAAIAQYFRYFDQNRLFLPPPLATALHDFAKTVRAPAIDFGVYLQIEYPTDMTKREKQEKWKALFDFSKNEVPKLREAIESEFRSLLEPWKQKDL